MVPSLSFSAPRVLRHLLLAGAAALCLTGAVAAQSTEQQPPAAGSGLILPGAVKTPQQSGSPAAGTIGGGPAAGTIGQPAASAPAAGTVGAAAQGGPAARPTAAAPASPPKPVKPGVPKGEWQVGPQVFSDGSFKMCGASVEFDNNLHLIFLRNPAKRVQMVLGIPGAQMPTGQRAALKVSIDGKINRELGAVVSQPNALAIGLGDDAELLKGLTTGSVLTIEVPGDTASFQLKGTTKAMNDLTNCVDQGVAGTLKLPQPTEPVIAPTLAKLLVDAGLSNARAIPIDKIPPQQRPGDYAWQLGDKVLGAVRSFPMGEAAGDFNKVADTYMEQLKKSCEGTYTPSLAAAEKLPAYQVRSGSVSCESQGSKIHVALVMQLIELPKQQGQEQAIRVLNVFSHESTDAEKAQADAASAGIVKVLKEKGKEPLPTPGAPAPAAAPKAN
ncbi:MAG: hypothetical protein ACOVN0_06295 [Niveispirillum sp.]|uniref:hypothetical protein n=1 Tax=Niveispirillum sp. TaxID=1917217 RepID=UPI003BA49CE6